MCVLHSSREMQCFQFTICTFTSILIVLTISVVHKGIVHSPPKQICDWKFLFIYFPYYGIQWGMRFVWSLTFLQISSIVLSKTKTFIWVWNNLGVIKRWGIVFFWWTIPLIHSDNSTVWQLNITKPYYKTLFLCQCIYIWMIFVCTHFNRYEQFWIK